MNLYQATRRSVRLEGLQIGKFVNIEYIGSKPKSCEAVYACTCMCGNTTIVSHGHLNSGHTVSCGCHKPNTTHGMSNTKLYHTWENIKQRCHNSNHPSFQEYGGRGIYMSKEFYDDFKVFAEYMGDPPSASHSVDRIDVNKGYERGNLRWATASEQSMNKRKLKRNTTGTTGVCRTKRHGTEYYVAFVKFNGMTKHKCINIKKHGEVEAYNLAVKAREDLVHWANSNGASFTENHGK